MQTVDLKLMVETLSKCMDQYSNLCAEFKKEARKELPSECDQFRVGMEKCHNALGAIIGAIEVNNIRKRM